MIIIMRGQRLSVLRLIPLGLVASRVEIHQFSLIFLRTGPFTTSHNQDWHVLNQVSSTIEVGCHRLLIHPLVHDVSLVVVLYAMEGLACLFHIFLNTPLALDHVDNIDWLARSCCLQLVLLSSTMALELICGQHYWTSFSPWNSVSFVARGTRGCRWDICSNQEISEVLWEAEANDRW